MSETMTKLKKFTAKDIMGVEKFEKPSGPVHLFTLFGAATSARIKPTQYNADQYVLSGRFRAVRNDGEKFESLEAYLPEPAQTIIAEALAPKEGQSDPPPIEFAYMIGIAPSKKGALGYTWTCEPMMDEKAQDAVSAIERLIANKIPKALPKPEEKPATGGKK